MGTGEKGRQPRNLAASISRMGSSELENHHNAKASDNLAPDSNAARSTPTRRSVRHTHPHIGGLCVGR